MLRFPRSSRRRKATLPHLQSVFDAAPLRTTPIADVVWMVFDIETNSLDYRKAVPLSIAVLPVTTLGYQPSRLFETLLKPPEPMRHVGAAVHQLMPEQLQDGLDEPEFLEQLAGWLPHERPMVWVGHHARFDYEILKRMLQRHGGFQWKPVLYCTASAAVREVHGRSMASLEGIQKDAFRLEKLVDDLGLSGQARHQAAQDVAHTAQLLLHQLAHWRQKGASVLSEALAYGKPIH